MEGVQTMLMVVVFALMPVLVRMLVLVGKWCRCFRIRHVDANRFWHPHLRIHGGNH